MNELQALFLTVCLPILALGLHEITHLLAARTLSPVSVELTSYIPFRLQLNFHHTPSEFKLRLVALAPLLVGCIIAVVAIQSGSWQQLRHADPYYLQFLIGLNWLLYTSPSPADLRSALTTVERPTDKEVI